MSFLKLFLLLSCWTFTGIMAERPTATYYTLKNNSVCLNVSAPPPYHDAKWEFSGKYIYSRGSINPNYKEKAWLGPLNFSLCIKILTDEDAGIYKFLYDNGFFTPISETHQVIIQDMVPRPVMTMRSKHLSNLTEGSCSVTVNCSIQDNLLRSVCDKDGCSPSQKAFDDFNITVFTDNQTVVCSSNNHVSMNEITERLADNCFSTSSPGPTDEPPLPFGMLIYIILGLACILLVFSFLTKKLYYQNRKEQETTAARLISSGPLETGPQSEPRVSTSSSSEAEASYENVDMTQTAEIRIRRDQQVASQSQEADTVYSMPRPMASRLKSNGSRENTQEPLQSVSLDETQQPTHTDTVYCLLQKPKI